MPQFISYLIGALALLLWPAQPAFATATYEINAPFDPGTSWNVCQGYNNTYGTHTGTSSLSLDITGGAGCDNSASGRNIRAPFAGTISWYVAASGSLCITASGNTRSIMLTHINSSLARGVAISANQIVGSIAKPGDKQNNGVAHAHLQAWSSSGCSGDSNRIPFDNAHNMRMCGAPNFTTSGPNSYNNGTWSGTSFTAKQCSPNPAPAVAGETAVYRFWSEKYNHHFYTSSFEEVQSIYNNYDYKTWAYEGYVFYTPSSATTPNDEKPVYRFWSDKFKSHFYTASEEEKQNIIDTYGEEVWKYEGVAFNAYLVQDLSNARTPVYRFWSDRYDGHFYTTDTTERDQIIQRWPDVWNYEGIAFYVS